MSDLMSPVRVARGGRSFDLAGFRVRVEAGRHDVRVEELIQFMVDAITEKQERAADVAKRDAHESLRLALPTGVTVQPVAERDAAQVWVGRQLLATIRADRSTWVIVPSVGGLAFPLPLHRSYTSRAGALAAIAQTLSAAGAVKSWLDVSDPVPLRWAYGDGSADGMLGDRPIGSVWLGSYGPTWTLHRSWFMSENDRVIPDPLCGYERADGIGEARSAVEYAVAALLVGRHVHEAREAAVVQAEGKGPCRSPAAGDGP